jgi:hypothetical protein
MQKVISRTAILALATTLLYCGSKSTSSGLTGPSNSLIIGIKISAPPSIAPGTTVQLSAIGHHADNSSNDITVTAVWHSSDTSVLTISDTGLATGVRNGETVVTAALAGAAGAPTGSQTIVVVPAGTFRLKGEVVGFLGGALDGALVQVTAGTGTGQSTTTHSGSFAFYGVAGDIQVTVSETGYVTATQAITVNDNNATLRFNLPTVTPPPDVSGSYAVRVTADPGCPSAAAQGLPDIARDRQYVATIAGGNGFSLTASLTGATFAVVNNYTEDQWFGHLTPDGASFDVNDPMYYYAGRDFAEVLPDGSLYYFHGFINVRASGNNLVGTLNGTITFQTSQGLAPQCSSSNHTVTFTRPAALSPARSRR